MIAYAPQSTDGRPLAYGPAEEEQGFLQAIHAAPHESTNHLVYADWLQEQGEHDEAAFRRSMGNWVAETLPKRRTKTLNSDFPDKPSVHRYPFLVDPTHLPEGVHLDNVALSQWPNVVMNPATGIYDPVDPAEAVPVATLKYRLLHWQTYRHMEEGLRRAFMAHRAANPQRLARPKETFAPVVQTAPTTNPRVVEDARATHYETAHAPPGGVTVAGKQFKGGQFIPGEVMASASPEERRAVETGQSRNKPLPPQGGVTAQTPPPADQLHVSAYLPPDEQELERQSQLFVRQNYEQLKQQYLAANAVTDVAGNVVSVTLNTDEWRSLIPGYNGTNAGAVHAAASWCNKRLVREAVANQRGKGNNKFMVLAGGGGSGKGTATQEYFTAAQYPVVLDQVSDAVEKLEGVLDDAKRNGYEPVYVFVDRPPQDAAQGVIGRALNLLNRGQIPRTVNLDIALRANIESRRTALELFKRRPDITPNVIDNRGGRFSRRLITDRAEAIVYLETRLQEDEAAVNTGLAQRLKQHVIDRHEEGEIPPALVDGFLGRGWRGMQQPVQASRYGRVRYDGVAPMTVKTIRGPVAGGWHVVQSWRPGLDGENWVWRSVPGATENFSHRDHATQSHPDAIDHQQWGRAWDRLRDDELDQMLAQTQAPEQDWRPDQATPEDHMLFSRYDDPQDEFGKPLEPRSDANVRDWTPSKQPPPPPTVPTTPPAGASPTRRTAPPAKPASPNDWQGNVLAGDQNPDRRDGFGNLISGPKPVQRPEERVPGHIDLIEGWAKKWPVEMWLGQYLGMIRPEDRDLLFKFYDVNPHGGPMAEQQLADVIRDLAGGGRPYPVQTDTPQPVQRPQDAPQDAQGNALEPPAPSSQDRRRAMATMDVVDAKPIAQATAAHKGMNETELVTFQDGSRGVFKPQNGEDAYLRGGIYAGSYYQREAAASELADALGFGDLVPATTTTSIRGRVGSVQDFSDGATAAAKMGDQEKYDGKHDLARAATLDYILGHSDRHDNNWLVKDGKLVLIDNGLSLPHTYDEGDYFNYMFWSAASWHRLPVTPIPAQKWPEVEQSLQRLGIEPEAIQLTKQRFDHVAGGKFKTFDQLPCFWLPDDDAGEPAGYVPISRMV